MTTNELLSRKKIIQVEIKQLKTELDEINSDIYQKQKINYYKILINKVLEQR